MENLLFLGVPILKHIGVNQGFKYNINGIPNSTIVIGLCKQYKDFKSVSLLLSIAYTHFRNTPK